MNELRIFLRFHRFTHTSLETNRYKNFCLQDIGHFTFNNLVFKLLFIIPSSVHSNRLQLSHCIHQLEFGIYLSGPPP